MTSPKRANFNVSVRDCSNILPMVNRLLSEHISFNGLTPELLDRFSERYLHYLDRDKTTLLFEDAEVIRSKVNRHLNPSNMLNCSNLVEIHELVLGRLKENEEFVKRFLGEGFQYNPGVSVTTNEEYRGYSADKRQKEDRLRNSVYLQLAAYLGQDLSIEHAVGRTIRAHERAVKYFLNDDSEDIADLYLDSLASALDPYSTHFTPAEAVAFNEAQTSIREGLGVVLSSKDGYPIIDSIVPDSPAGRSGKICAGDRLLMVKLGNLASVSVFEMEPEKVEMMFLAQDGQSVSLYVMHGDQSTEYVTLTPGRIEDKASLASLKVEERIIQGKTVRVGILEFSSFYRFIVELPYHSRSVSEDVVGLISSAGKLDGLVIDISRNSGGMVDEARRLAGLFVQSGGILGVLESGKKEAFIQFDPYSGVIFGGPIVILQSRNTASAAEIFAGALKARGRAVVVGADHSYQKGTMQIIHKLGGGELLKVTNGFTYFPDGNPIQRQGVRSDIVIPSMTNGGEQENETYSYSLPVPPDIQPFTGDNDASITEKQIAVLRKKSALRIKGNKTLHASARKKLGKVSLRMGDYVKSLKEKIPDPDPERTWVRIAGQSEAELEEANAIVSDLIVLDWENLQTSPTAKSTGPRR